MARDPADVLAERRFDERFGTGEWQHTRGAVGGGDQREPWLKAARRDLAALDAAGYEVRPKAEEGVITLHGKPWRIVSISGESDGPTGDVVTLSEVELVPVTDGDDPDQ